MSLLSCCSPLSHEARLLKDCYPPSKQLVPPPLRSNDQPSSSTHIALDASYKPLNQELSRLTYHASNKPGTLNMLGRELEDKVSKDVVKSKSGHAKNRIYLLISLQILRALILECKQDLSLFSRSALRIINQSVSLALQGTGSLSGGGVDLEMAVRVGSCFTAFATYADAQTLGIDDGLSRSYVTILQHFASMAVTTGAAESMVGAEKVSIDQEKRNRTRLVGLAALSAAGDSDLMFLGSSDFEEQVKVILPVLLANINLAELEELKFETARAQTDNSPSPYFSEFAARPAMSKRRAPSLRNHVAGVTGPSTSDVVGAALHTFRSILSQCQASQVSQAISICVESLHGKKNVSPSVWGDAERCCWLAESMTMMVMLQYRLTVPATLMTELQTTTKDTGNQPSVKCFTLLSMLKSILSSEKISLVGISSTELLGALCNLITARVAISETDAMLSPLVDCVAALGCHVYYADQANDLIEEIINRISSIQSAGSSGSDKVREETIRVLVASMTNILLARQLKAVPTHAGQNPGQEKGYAQETEAQHSSFLNESSGRRNPVSPAIWQETLPLLCESNFAVRAEYARSLLLYLKQECPAQPKSNTAFTSIPRSSLTTDPFLSEMARFLNALFATLYTLAISSQLGFAGAAVANGKIGHMPNASSTSPGLPPLGNGPTTLDHPSSNSQTRSALSNGSEHNLPERPSVVNRRSSKLVALPYNRANAHQQNTLSTTLEEAATENDAGPFDFLVIQEVINLVFTKFAPISVVLGAPMLVALDKEASLPAYLKINGLTGPRRQACRELVLSGWMKIASDYQLQELNQVLIRAKGDLISPSMLYPGPVSDAKSGLYAADRPVSFPIGLPRVEFVSDSRPIVDAAEALQSLSSAPSIQSIDGVDRGTASNMLASPWTVESALHESVEQFGLKNISRRPSYIRAADSLIGNSSTSLHSYLQAGGIDVNDLREALAVSRSASYTRGTPDSNSMASMGSRGPNDQTLSRGDTRRKMKPDEAKEILRDIFRKKDQKRKMAGLQAEQSPPVSPRT